MINNAPAARPQSGISEADILYEVLAEGGITRLIGIFQSHAGVVKIGPIRSIRPYLLDIGESYGGITVHAGGSPDAYAILQRQKKADMDEIGRAGAYFWRDKERKAPHNLYSNAAKLREGAVKLGYAESVKVPGFLFNDPDYIPVEGTPALALGVNFLLKSYNVGYHYNAEQRIYARWVNGKPHLDLNNNRPVEAANIIVMGSDHKVLDDVGGCRWIRSWGRSSAVTARRSDERQVVAQPRRRHPVREEGRQGGADVPGDYPYSDRSEQPFVQQSSRIRAGACIPLIPAGD